MLDGEAGVEVARGGYAPGNGWSIVGEAEAAIGAEQNDAAVPTESIVEVGDGFAGSDFRRSAGGYAIGSPFAKDEFHDGFAPPGERYSGGKSVGVAAATDEG